MKPVLVIAVLCSTVFSVSGCGSSDPAVSVVDLNKVLDIVEKVLKEPAPGGATTAKPDAKTKTGEVQPIDEAKENKGKTAAFLTKLAAELNKAKLIEDTIGVQLRPDGAIEGFIDQNKDGKKSGANEKRLFTVEIDTERNRLIAIDDTGQGGETYRRERGYRPGLGTGLFMGYMLGSMMGRQNRYYSGSRAGMRPRYGSMSMSSSNYHRGAVTSARSRSKASGRSYSGRRAGGSRGGARRGGGGSFRGGGK